MDSALERDNTVKVLAEVGECNDIWIVVPPFRRFGLLLCQGDDRGSTAGNAA
jgi:hypothetical protein